MPFDIKEGLTHKIGPLPAFAWGLIGGGGFLIYRHFHPSGGSQPSAVATDTYGNPATDLGQSDGTTDPSGVWPGGYGVGGTAGSIVGNTGDATNPSDNTGTAYADPYSEYLSEQSQMLSDFLGALPQTWGLGDTPLNTVVSHDPTSGSTGSPDVINPTGSGAPAPAPTIDTRLTNSNPAKVPSLAEFLSSHPADNKTDAGKARLTALWTKTFGTRYAAYQSATGGQVVQPPHSLTGGGAPPPRMGVAPAYQPVQQQRLPVAPPATVPATLAPASSGIASAVAAVTKAVSGAVSTVLNPATTNASGSGRQVGPWATAAMRDAGVAPAKASGKKVRTFSQNGKFYAEIFD